MSNQIAFVELRDSTIHCTCQYIEALFLFEPFNSYYESLASIILNKSLSLQYYMIKFKRKARTIVRTRCSPLNFRLSFLPPSLSSLSFSDSSFFLLLAHHLCDPCVLDDDMYIVHLYRFLAPFKRVAPLSGCCEQNICAEKLKKSL